MYSILELKGKEYGFIVIMNTQKDPEDILDEIEHDLRYMSDSECDILFDLLLYRGDSNARFLEAKFDGQYLDKDSFSSVIIKKKDYIRQITSDYFRDNRELLWGSELSDYQKQLIIRGDFL